MEEVNNSVAENVEVTTESSVENTQSVESQSAEQVDISNSEGTVTKSMALENTVAIVIGYFIRMKYPKMFQTTN